MIKKGLLYLKTNAQLRNFGVYGIGQFFNLVTPLIVAPYVIAICGISGYGKASLAMALMFFLIVFVDFGADIFGVKNVSIARHDKKALEKTFTVAYSARLLLFLAIAIPAVVVFLTVPYFARESKLFLFSLLILAGQLVNPSWFLQGVENFMQITFANVVSKFIYLGGIFVFISEPEDYILINLIWGCGMLTAYSLSFWAIMRQYSFSFKNMRSAEVKKYLADGFPIFYSQVFLSAQMYSPIVIIGIAGNDVMAGQYRVIDQVIVVFKTYILLFFNFVFSRVCYLLDQAPRRGMRYWRMSNGANFAFLVLSMLALWLFSGNIVSYFDPSHVDALSPLLRIAVWIPLLMGISVPLKQLVIGAGRENRYTQITIGVVVGNIALIFWLLPMWGVNGVLHAIIIAEAATVALFFVAIKDKILEWSK